MAHREQTEQRAREREDVLISNMRERGNSKRGAPLSVSSASPAPETMNVGPCLVSCCGSYDVDGTSRGTCSQSEPTEDVA